MSNRMSVLSRRLERCAAALSVVTFACFLVGLYAAANHEGQMLYLAAGLGLVCLFVATFLWLAHGFAWAMIPTETSVVRRPAEVEEMRPAQVERPAEAERRAEPKRSAEALQPVEASKPAEEKRAPETKRPAEAPKPSEVSKPVEAKTPARVLWHGEEMKPLEPLPPLQEELKPLEVTQPVEKMESGEDPPNAKYTITGRRIS